MRLAQLSDFHFTRLTINPLRLFPKRWLGELNWLMNRARQFSHAQLDPLASLLCDLRVDLLLFGGDFTSTALREEFEKASSFVAQCAQPWSQWHNADPQRLSGSDTSSNSSIVRGVGVLQPTPWIAVPGNHDYYTLRSYRKKTFYRYFPNPSLCRDGITETPIAPRWRLVTLDTARAALCHSRGLFSPLLAQKLQKLLTQIPADHRIILFTHYPFFQNDAPGRILQGGPLLRTILENDPRIVLYLHGHTHRHAIADLQDSNLPVVLDGGSCAQGACASWNLIDVDDAGCTVFAYRWYSGWVVSQEERIAWRRGFARG